MVINCPECKNNFDVESAKKERFKFEGKKFLWLTYVDCPNCGKRIFCQIDNEETNRIINDISKLLCRILRYKRNGQGIPKKLQSKYNRSSEDLKRIRKDLVAKYNNQWFEGEDKHTWKVKVYYNE